MSKRLGQFAMNRKASPRTRVKLSVPSSSATFWMKRCCVGARSTAVTLRHSLERNSKLTAPVPAKRSRASLPSKSTMFSSTLKIFSRAKSVVGRAVMFAGTSKRRRPNFPLIIRIKVILQVGMVRRRRRGLRGTVPTGILQASHKSRTGAMTVSDFRAMCCRRIA